MTNNWKHSKEAIAISYTFKERRFRKKRKIKVIKESGKLEQIYELFIMPLLHMKPENMTYREWLEDIFHKETRHILQYRVIKGFEMPGLFRTAPNVLIQEGGSRKIRRKTSIWMRFDMTKPKEIDVETAGGRGHKPQIFKLTRVEWGSIMSCLEMVPWKKAR